MFDMSPRHTAIDLAQTIARDPAFRDALADLIAFKTDASLPDAPLEEFLRHVGVGFESMGFRSRGFKSRGKPFLLASRVEDPALPTVLGYAHGDTVPGMEGQWACDRDPWTLTEEPDTGRWYGRGIADNKGQLLVNMTAMQAVIAARGKLGFNAHFLIEMGEEIGSPGLHHVCALLYETLRADILVASDGPRVAVNEPTVFLGARGAATVKLTLKRREGGRHSGNFGGALANPALELAHALSRIASRRGEVLVPGWTPESKGIPEATREALAGVVPAGGDVDPEWGARGLTPAERIHAWNSAEVLSFSAADIDAPVNAIPSEASALVQLRYVPGIDESKIVENLRTYLRKEGFHEIAVTPTGATFKAAATPADHPAVQFARASIERTVGKAPVVLPSLGGSLPNDVFTDRLGIPTIWVPHSYPGCSQHAPDEHLPAALFPEATGIMAGLYWDLGDAKKSDLIAD